MHRGVNCEEIPRRLMSAGLPAPRELWKELPLLHCTGAPYSLFNSNTNYISYLAPKSNIACNDGGLLVAEVGNVVHNLLCVGICHCLAQVLLTLEIEDRGYAVLVFRAELNDAE